MDHHHVSYRERAALYAVEYADTADFAFLYGLIDPSVGSILEIPCGVGRNVVNIARSGCPIVAVDREPEMVRALTERLADLALPSTVEAVVGDLTTLRLGRRFDLVLVPREAFQLLADRAAAAASLSALAAHLSAGGRLVVDLSPFARSPSAPPDLRPDYFDPALPDDVWADDWCRRVAPGAALARRHLQHHRADGTLRIDFRYEMAGAGEPRRTETSTEFRLYGQRDFASLAESCGLRVAACHGDYSGKAFEEGDPRMIFVLRPAEIADPLAPGHSLALSERFSNARDAVRVADFASTPLRADVLEASRAYAEAYFSGPFIEGQGSEVLLDSMRAFGLPGRTLDVGAGSSTLFWHMPVGGPRSIACADIAPEPLAILRDLAAGGGLPACYGWITARYGLDAGHVERFRASVSDFLVFDALARWPAFLDREAYDLITAFGVLSLNPDPARYRASFGEIARHLRPGGRTIGADWLRRPAFRTVNGHDNGYLDAAVLEAALDGAGLRTITCRKIAIAGDPYYEGLLHWVAER